MKFLGILIVRIMQVWISSHGDKRNSAEILDGEKSQIEFSLVSITNYIELKHSRQNWLNLMRHPLWATYETN